MKSQISALKLLVSISLVLIISSCEEDENPTKASDDKILTYGNFFYTLVGGFDQEGTSGQFLDKEIRLMITNLEGKPVNRNIEVSISDPTGEVLDISGYDSDTITIKWRLGCADIDQVLTFKDRNVCGVAKDDCIDIDLFQIKINPYNEFIEGWYTPCNTYSHNANKYLVSDERIFFKNSVRAFLSSEPYTKNWNRINIPSGMSSGRFNMLSNGELFFLNYNFRHLYSEKTDSWIDTNLPFSNNNILIKVSEEGTYLAIENS
ncbi:MAG TPA: hypothetical protein DDY13_03030, partial [Cytophagales bacterium]|nr:hypothetical protein [Cytophagales bacterium]